jgi:HemY protein
MRRLFFLSLVVLLCGVGLVALIESDPGYVLISYGLTTVEMSVWVGLILLLLFNIVCYAVFRVWRSLMAGRGSFASWREGRKSRKGQQLTSKGLFSFMQGDWADARRVLARAAPHSDTPALNYLMAARASHALRDNDKVEHYLDAATLADTRASRVVGLTRAELLLEVGRAQDAVELLESLGSKGAADTRLLQLKLQAYRDLARWDDVLQLLPALKKSKLLVAAELESLEREAYTGLFKAASTSAEDIERVWDSCPNDLRSDPGILALYVQGLLRRGEQAAADTLLERALKKHWDSRLVKLYGLIDCGDPARRQRVAEHWLKNNPEDPELLLCLGRLALRNEVWGQAREYFESSNRLHASSETCAELARLLFNLGEREKSAQCYRQGLSLSETELPQLPQPSIAPR